MGQDLNRSIKIFLDSAPAAEGAKRFTNAISVLEEKMAALEAAGKGASVEYSNLAKKLESQKAQLKTYQATVADTERVLRNLSGASKNELDAVYKLLAKDLKTLGRETDEYKEKLKLMNAVEYQRTAAMQEMRGEVGRQGSSLSRLADGFNKYAALGASAIATITGVTMAFKALKDERDKQEESAANLKALTGLGDADIETLKGFANRLATTTQEGGVIIRQSVTEILDAYTKVGSAKPELLGNADALNEVTKQTLILSAASKDDLQNSVAAVTLALNMYGEGADQASRYVNVFAAGSKAGAAEVPSITEAVRKAGVSAAQAKIPIEALVGSIETLAEKGIKDEQAGTGLKTFLLKLETGAKNTRPSVVGLQTALENLRKQNMDAGKMKDMFGLEAYNVASVMIESAEKVDFYTKAVTGTNVAMEQAAINSDTATARLAQAKNQITQAGIAFIEKLNPAITHSINLTTSFVRVLTELPSLIRMYGFELTVAATAIVYFTLIMKAQAIEAKAAAIATDLLNSATIRFVKSLAKNPYTYVIAGASAALVWLNNYLNKQKEVNIEQDKFNDLAKKSKDIFDENKSIEDRIKVVQSLTREQLQSLKSDISQQISASGRLDAEMLTRAKKVYEEDAKLIELKKKSNNAKSEIEKAYIATEISHREEDVFNEISSQYNKNQKSISILKKHLSEVDKLLSNKRNSSPGLSDEEKKKAVQAQKDALSLITKTIDTEHENRLNKIKEAKLKEGMIESVYNDKILTEDTSYYTLKEKALTSFLKKVKDKDLRSDIQKQIADVHGKLVDQQLKYQNRIDQILLDANPEKKEQQEYENRLREVGLFGIEKEKMTKDQLAALELLEKEHNDNLYNIRKRAKDQAKKQAEDKFNEQYSGRKNELNDSVDQDQFQIDLMDELGALSPASKFKKEEYLSKKRIGLIRDEMEARQKAGLDITDNVKQLGVAEKNLTLIYAREYKRRIDEAKKWGEAIGSGIGAMIEDSEDGGNTLLKNMISMGLQWLAQEAQQLLIEKTTATDRVATQMASSTAIVGIKAAEATAIAGTSTAAAAAQSYAMPDSVATFGATGTARTVIISGLIAAGLAAALALTSKLFSKKPPSDPPSNTPTPTATRTVNQRAQGKYDVIGNEDGFLYRGVQYGGNVPTGVVSRPTLYGERGAELAVSAPDFRRLQRHINYPLVVQAINDSRRGVVPQRATGKYDTIDGSGGVSASATDPEMKVIMSSVVSLLGHLAENGVTADVLQTDLDRQKNRQERNKRLRSGK